MIDFNFIMELEGFELVGYVPKPDGGDIESGITIASGFDLGQRSPDEVPRELKGKLAPFCGVTGYDAIKLLDENLLVLDYKECELINKYSHDSAVKSLLKSWPSDCIPFSCLSDECQTVVASVAFQYGSLEKRTPNFWRQVTSGDWYAALSNLRNFGDSYSTRRNKEADNLEARLNEVEQ